MYNIQMFYTLHNDTFNIIMYTQIMTGMSEEDNATESAVEFLSSISQPSESNTVTSVADVVETSVTSFPMVSQSSELDTEEGATETMETSLSTVLQPSVSITNAAVEKLLETAPAKASRSNCTYILWITLKLEKIL